MASTFIVCDPIFKGHATYEKREVPARYDAIIEVISELGLKILKPREATEEELLLCHDEKYINTVRVDVEGALFDERALLSTDDKEETFLSADSYKVALYAVGGVLGAVDAVMEKIARNVFCVVRPPGHHATKNAGMGFCIFNNVAIAARYAQKKFGVERILIVDWDVHHGNGTQEIFEDDPSVFYFSIHQALGKDDHPFYPGTGKEDECGKGEGIGTTLNVPIIRSDRSNLDILEAFANKLIPAMESFEPQIVLISCGFDARKDDLIGQLNLTDENYASLTRQVMYIADKYAQGRIVSALEGGYNLNGIANAARSHVTALMSLI